MNAPSSKQIDFIRSLVAERQEYLSKNRPTWLVPPTTVKQASNIIELLRGVPRDPVAVDPKQESKVNALRALIVSLPTHDACFALSLVGQFESKGRLSDKQWSCVDDLLSRTSSTSVPSEPVGEGLYVLDGETFKVVTGKAGRRYAQRLVGRKWTYDREAIRKLTDAHKMTSGQATEHGKKIKCCVNCFRNLTDTRSRAVRYGETCATNHGWFYPTLEQAHEIHRNDPDHVCQWERTSTETRYSTPQLGTGDWTDTYTCTDCGKTDERRMVKNYSGD